VFGYLNTPAISGKNSTSIAKGSKLSFYDKLLSEDSFYRTENVGVPKSILAGPFSLEHTGGADSALLDPSSLGSWGLAVPPQELHSRVDLSGTTASALKHPRK